MIRDHEILIEHQYLNLPVQNGAPVRKIRFLVNGQIARVFDIELAQGEPDFWVFSDVSAFKGQQLEIEIDGAHATFETLATIIQSDTIEGGENLYQEKHRPQ